ncbi:Tat pathway signal protein [Streptomyces sp. YC504]|uniref:Tat pathway signal protein n=1 Tax=Streptomyces mesophilus TaxID=1775132 RepID=A0A6G4XEN2_9ACTN|nr:Tat pathway signal protein [Streptomyces mesophilus]NGO75310.1 Tat pathway signal protein [Streptomyces mesophilus]
MRGYDRSSDDWDDEGTLGTLPPYNSKSNAVCLWQKILWAEGAKWHSADGWVPFKSSMIDGTWDINVRYATQDLQRRWSLGADGLVGGGTFGRAENHLVYGSGSTDRGERLELTYVGKLHSFDVVRNTEGKYVFKDRQGDWRQAGYDYLSCG